MSDRTKENLFHAFLPIGGTGLSLSFMFLAIAIAGPVSMMAA